MQKLIKKLRQFLKKNDLIFLLRRYILEKRNKIFYSKINQKKDFIKKQFKKKLKQDLDWTKQPVKFNEKIQFRKLYSSNELYAICADKYRVREYVKEKIGEKYLIPLLLVTEKLSIEQWNQLPNSFVIKPNHDNGTVKIVKNKTKANRKKIINFMNLALKLDYGIFSMESYYSLIKPKIIIEEFLENENEKDLVDYKFFCFFGDVKYCQVIRNRNSNETIDFYDINWKKQNFTGLNIGIKNSEVTLLKPVNFDLMVKLASKLSKDFSFVRVDFYNVNGKIYFGELTFCPASGFGTFNPEEWNETFGSFWNEEFNIK